MRCQSMQTPIWTLVGFAFYLQGCHLSPPAVPNLGGTHVARSAEIQADKKAVDEILGTFHHAEEAVQQRDLDTLMRFYADNYKNRGWTKDTLRHEWKQLFQDYHDLSITHVLTRIAVDMDRTPASAHVTCTGSLWGISNETNQQANIDSWFGEVHYLAYIDGVWRMQGHVWEVLDPKEARTARPSHPFF
jgi:hypothetical protein